MPKYSQHLRVGLQCKASLILILVVLAVTMAGGWFYFNNTSASLRSNDLQHAGRLGMSLEAATRYYLRDGQAVALERLAEDYLRDHSVRFLAILDSKGRVVASASRELSPRRWSRLANLPLSVSSITQVDDDVLTVVRPVVLPEALFWEDHLVGAVRLVVDTTSTTRSLAGVRKRMAFVATAIILCVIPVGYLLVWRVLVQPFRKLLVQTRRLSEGDFDARAGFKRNDEVGELADSFDTMASEIARMRTELVLVNEGLERKVAARTTQIRQANCRLQEEMAEKEEFLRAVSHDLNAPLRNIAGMTTLILMKWRDDLPGDAAARLQRIQVNVDAQASLISELLELSRIRSRPQKRKLVNMSDLLRDLTGAFEYELKYRRIELHIDASIPDLYVERNRIRQVFQNLIDNAIKYMDRSEGGRIEIGYSRTDGVHKFSVADNGPGIDPEDRKQIFQVFRRSENAAVAKVCGKGVGLALVKTVMANYGGRTWVESELGRGATFFVTLDVENTAPPKEQAGHERPTDQPALHPAG